MDGSTAHMDHDGWYTNSYWYQDNWDQDDGNYRAIYWNSLEFQITMKVDMTDVVYDEGNFWPKQAYPGLACNVKESQWSDFDNVDDFYPHSYTDNWYHECEARNVDASMGYLTAGLAALMASTSFF